MALVAVGPLLGGGRGGEFDGFVHASALSAMTSHGKGEAVLR
jgi:hypothetical protein